MNLASAVLCYFVPFMYIRSKGDYERFLGQVLVAGFLAMMYGIIVFLLVAAGVDIRGANLGASVETFGVFGTMREPNIFGSYSGSMLVLGSALILRRTPYSSRHRLFLRIFVFTALCALILSFARAAWVGAVIGLFMVYAWEKSVWRALKRLGVLIGATSIVLITLFGSVGVSTDNYSYKVTNLFNFEEGTGLWRAVILAKSF